MTASTGNLHTKTWRVEVFIGEHDGDTHAEARLDTGERTVSGTGTARQNPHDAGVPEIGDELAVGRALSALAGELLHLADEDVDANVTRR
ncbi:DUF1876 domain-containing protein [Nocardioides sp. GY 10113]|uniref:DUF1876 domain-containing protein n=1 Tax=Nocardioides sp. GY 10113 TaxID=2569761 RepID=UPI0010A753FD|nr:DUF1876 domain-containing protein [Nocardioides sp. GY 10113]TIC87598.1 DUF1876 domain-containing protein [Nocardioides sp. GY 10113]